MSQRDELRRLMAWKADAMEVLGRWDEVFARVPTEHIRLGEMRSSATGRYIDHLTARLAELEAIPPHPYYLPWIKTDPTVKALVLRTDIGWVHIGTEPPVPPDPDSEAWLIFTTDETPEAP